MAISDWKISKFQKGMRVDFSKKNHEISENFVFIGIFHKNA